VLDSEGVNLRIAIYNRRRATLPMARSMCACCAGPWTWEDFTRYSLSVTRHSFRSWRIAFCQSRVDAWSSVIGTYQLLCDTFPAGIGPGTLTRAPVVDFGLLILLSV